MDRDPDFLNQEEAARLWQRAAQLQDAEPPPSLPGALSSTD